MERFHYQTVLTGVIVGLAVTELLRCLANLVSARQRTRAYWVHVVWMGIVFMMCVQYWFAAFYWRVPDTHRSSFVTYLAALSVPVMLYLAATVITPREVSGDRLVDFRRYYYANHRSIFAVFALTMLVYATYRTLEGGGSWVRPSNLVRGAAILVLACLMIWGNRRFHEVMVFVVLGLFALFTLLF